MVFDEKTTIVVLNPTESLIDFLNPDMVSITEYNELYSLRGLELTHPLFDEGNTTTTNRYSQLLLPGNKVWRATTCDGTPCLYVLNGEKEYNYEDNTITHYAEEVAVELGQVPPFRSSSFTWTVNASFINTYMRNLVTPGVLTGPSTSTSYNGCLTPLSMLREIEANTGGEFQFRYNYEAGRIYRYLDYLNMVGTTHTTPIELGYNAKNISVKINEEDSRIAAAPIGEPSSDTSNFHAALKSFEDLVVSTSVQIPLWVTKDESGVEVNGPLAYPPYPKPAGQGYVACDVEAEQVANYLEVQRQSTSPGTYPRMHTFTTSEENEYNIYWLCVTNLREHLEPEINIDCTVADLNAIDGRDVGPFNVGDTVYIRIPGLGNVVEARVLKTTKNPREPDSDKIEIGNYITDFNTTRIISGGVVDIE
jgi:hypothetical protein